MARKCPQCGQPIAGESDFSIFVSMLAVGFVGMVMGCGFWFVIQGLVLEWFG